MDARQVKAKLAELLAGRISIEEATEALAVAPFLDLDYAKVDVHRELRKGFPEVIFCEGKRPEQVARIFERLASAGTVLGTRATAEQYQQVRQVVPEARYDEWSRCIVFEKRPPVPRGGTVLVVSAGTADLPVAEEAVVTAQVMGNPVTRLYDVGVAGIHRLLAHLDLLRSASVLIVVAGMEGALPSVVGGLVRRPVIAVPTSVGYGANFGGLSALLGMLNSCASGVTVVNIDNGFGAGYAATLMNQLSYDATEE